MPDVLEAEPSDERPQMPDVFEAEPSDERPQMPDVFEALRNFEAADA